MVNNADAAVLPQLRDELATELARAERDRVPVEALTARYTGLGIEDAYAIQSVGISRRIDTGARIVGRKVGLTSIAMQQQLGVDQPDFGAILDDMVLENEGTFDASELIAPRVEGEFAFLLRSTLPTEGLTLDTVRAAVGDVAVAQEIIDSRIANWKIGLIDTIADNASSARIVTGEWVPATPELLDSLPGRTLSIHRDDEELGSGPGSAVLGDPLVALLWLAETLGSLGDPLRAGDVVLAGAVHASVPLTGGSVWTAASAGLPPATITTI